MTNRQAETLHQGLTQLSGTLSGVRFNYAISRNIKRLESITQALEAARKPSKDYLAFEAERVSLMDKFCDQDKNGNPIKEVIGNQIQFSITQRLPAFQKALQKLSATHSPAIQEREKQTLAYEQLLDKPLDEPLKLYPLLLEDIPGDITRDDFQRINPLLQEED